jgi:RNA polymerase sigma-70 factor (ECF subfamily)
VAIVGERLVNPYDVEPDGLVDLEAQLHAARGGDEDAFGRLYTAVQPGLLRYLRLLVGRDAEDVAAEAWQRIARDLRSYRGGGAGFRAWTASVARHRAVEQLRRRSRRHGRTAPVEQMERPPGPDTATPAVNIASTDAAIALIATLPRERAEALVLRVVFGLDAEAVGQVVGKRPGAVRRAARRGLRQLARELNQNRAAPSHTAGGTPVPGFGGRG